MKWAIVIIFGLIALSGIIVYAFSVLKNRQSDNDEDIQIIKVWGLSPLNFLMFMCFMLLVLEFISSFPFQKYMQDRDVEISNIKQETDSLMLIYDGLKLQQTNTEKDLEWLKNYVVCKKPVKTFSTNRVYVNNSKYNTTGKTTVQNN